VRRRDFVGGYRSAEGVMARLALSADGVTLLIDINLRPQPP